MCAIHCVGYIGHQLCCTRRLPKMFCNFSYISSQFLFFIRHPSRIKKILSEKLPPRNFSTCNFSLTYFFFSSCDGGAHESKWHFDWWADWRLWLLYGEMRRRLSRNISMKNYRPIFYARLNGRVNRWWDSFKYVIIEPLNEVYSVLICVLCVWLSICIDIVWQMKWLRRP